jgi:hypothetical protein
MVQEKRKRKKEGGRAGRNGNIYGIWSGEAPKMRTVSKVIINKKQINETRY